MRLRFNPDRPDVQMALGEGDMVIAIDGDYQVIERDVCEGLYLGGHALVCGNPHCNVLHLCDDTTMRDIEQVRFLVNADAQSV